jgi:hypothetical protein
MMPVGTLIPLPLRASIRTALAQLRRPLQVGLAMGLLTALVTLALPNQYMSVAHILPVEAKGTGGFGGLAVTAAALGVSVPGAEGADANFVDILNSRWLKEGLLTTEYRFHARSWRFGAERAHQETLYAYLEAKNMDRAVNRLGSILGTTRDLKSKVITITAETPSPELSQQIVQRATALLNQFVLEKSRTRGGERAAFAEARLADARHEMDQAEATFRVFLDANRNYQVSADPGVRLRGANLEAELNLRRQLVTTLAINREQALLDAKNDIPILNMLDTANLPIDKSGPARTVRVLFLALVAFLVALAVPRFLDRTGRPVQS